MAALRMVTWNMEWMNDLFSTGTGAAAFRPDGDKPQHGGDTTVRERRTQLAGVLDHLDADIVVVVEGPNRTAELQLFFDEDVAGDWVTYIQRSPGQTQAVGVAVRTDRGLFAVRPFDEFDTVGMSEFEPFHIDVDDDEIEERYKFERRPLYVALHTAGGREVRILGLHLKSKGIFSAFEWSKWWQVSDANRKKLLAQASYLRTRFIDPFLRGEETRHVPLIVCGDINDGPGLDAGEKRIFGSAIERLMGVVWNPELCLRNALFESLPPRQQEGLAFEALATTSFKDPIFNATYHRSWIDHVLYSDNQGGRRWVRNGAIHERIDGEPIWRAFPHASDHFPISVIIDVEDN